MRRSWIKRGTSQMKRTPLRKVSPNKKKKPKVKNLKKKLDEIFSQYIRQKYADKEGYVSCYTCGKTGHWKEMQCGHFVSRSSLATRFSEDNCRVQCIGCNIFAGGKVSVFANNLERECEGIVVRLYRKAQEITKDYPYQEKIDHYLALLEDYKNL